MAYRRVQKELREIRSDPASGVQVEHVGNSNSHLTGIVQGPRDTPYDGGLFVVDIQLCDQYPFMAPKMKFKTKVWHPNVSSANGAICLDVLKDNWSPALTLKTALLSIQAMLAAPVPEDPQDAIVARQYMDSLQLFQRQAKQWTEMYATSASNEQYVDEKVKRLTDMGFPEAAVTKALEETDGNENAAMERLLG